MEKKQFVSLNHSKGVKNNKSLFKKIAAAAAVFGITATVFSTPSFAAELSGATVDGGDLTGGAITFAPLSATLTGSKVVSPTANWGISDIVDARGTGEGWNLTMTLSQFKEFDTAANDFVSGGKTLPTGSLKLTTAPTVAQKDDTSSPVDTITPVSAEQVLALDTDSPVKLLSASLNGGMGSYTVSDLGVELTVRADAYAKTYKSEATVSLTTAP
ncbi:WxL domain-containing protein [Neobacillus muris]|uniref:WxL domain-containing protein n=1 Tax=Neobacillus muris TaxID=2941334 RepID=UPI00203ED72E|nr:WxL domain-containing protein [Neobacillus muris]